MKTRWIEINKGDAENPVHRSRVVGNAFNDGQMDGLFAAPPPSEALRLLVHNAAIVRSDEENGVKGHYDQGRGSFRHRSAGHDTYLH